MKIRWATGLKSLRKHMIDFNIDVMIINDPNNIYRITSHKVIAPNINQIYLIVPKDGNPALICHNFIKPTFSNATHMLMCLILLKMNLLFLAL